MLLLLSVLASGLAAEEKPPNWERMKACAAQAEKAADRFNEELERNHYSVKYERCFMLTIRTDPANDHVFWERLRDAFEGTELAQIVMDFRKKDLDKACSIGYSITPCEIVGDYIAAHLTH
jgi:hypothetical protein